MRELDGTLFGPGQPCFGCGPDHPIGFRLRFAVEGEGDAREVVTEFTPSDAYQGPPGVMHGGLVTALADEIAAWVVIAATGKFGFTAELSCRLRRPVRIGVPVTGRGRVEKAMSRLVKVQTRLSQCGDEAFAGEFTFVLLDRAGAEKLLAGPLPAAWETFAR
jgi:acyl-coenzyme A thioesterase PaaI-like protein